MTLYCWIHWFWITCKLILCIASAHSKPVTSTNVGNLESLLVANRPLSRNTKSVGQNSNLQSQVPVPVTFPTKSGLSDTAINEILPQIYDTNSTLPANRCNYNLNTVNDTNTTIGQRNESQLFCNHSNTDNLLLSKDDVNLKLKNLSNTLFSDDDVEAKGDDASNVTTFLLSTRSYIDVDSNNVTSSSGISSVSITGITFGVLMFVGLVCATSFMLYRRGFANKPQTLNDKCSNLDSSGYIDDSSMRDNSEEMYSLDNDSFLNSLEAMTIQNYWTDNLKHTKL